MYLYLIRQDKQHKTINLDYVISWKLHHSETDKIVKPLTVFISLKKKYDFGTGISELILRFRT